MQPKLTVIDNLNDLIRLKEVLKLSEYVAYDTETTGLTARHEIIGYSICIDENEAFYVILAKWDVLTNKLIYQDSEFKDLATEIIKNIKDKKLIMHNGVFDCMMTEAFFKVRFIESLHTDTMVLAHLLNENERVGLKDLARIRFGESATKEQAEMRASIIANGGSVTKDNYDLYKADAHLIGKYGAMDAWLTYKLFIGLVSELYDQGLDKFFYEEESMPLLRTATYDLNTVGMQIDTKVLNVLKKTLEAEIIETKAFIYSEINSYVKDKYLGTNKKNTFNIGASQQLSWLLFGKLGLEFGTLTKAGKNVCKSLGLKLPYTYAAKKQFISVCEIRKGTDYQPQATVNGKIVKAKKVRDPWCYIAADKATLKKIAPKHKWVEKLLEYNHKNKLLNTYVLGIEERINYGVVTSSYLQHGTKTGRYASRNPNLQNLPRDDQRVKECFVSRPGKVFVSADYSQLEPRVFSFYSKDSRLMAAFDGTTDFYSVVGIEVYDKHDADPQKDGSTNAFGIKYKKLRDLSKVIALASAYGATPNQLAPTTGKSREDTAQDMEKYFEAFPGVKTMMLEAHELVKKQGYVTNLFGRKRRIPEAIRIPKMYPGQDHWDLPYEARKLLNMACNFRIQSTGGSLVNRAAIKFYSDCNELGINAKIISQIHDELVVEVDDKDAETTAILLQNAMESTNLLEGVKLEAIPRITKNLAK